MNGIIAVLNSYSYKYDVDAIRVAAASWNGRTVHWQVRKKICISTNTVDVV